MIRDGSVPVISAVDGLWAVAVASGLLQAGKDGRPVDLTKLAERLEPMTITSRPSRSGPSLLGGSIDVPVNPCRHGDQRSVQPWVGEPGTVGSVALVGAGKMGLPLAAQFAGHGWQVTAVDVNPAVVEAINAGRSHVGEEPGLTEAVAEAHAVRSAPRDDGRNRGGALGRRRRDHRSGHAQRPPAAGLPVHGRGGRRRSGPGSTPARW